MNKQKIQPGMTRWVLTFYTNKRKRDGDWGGWCDDQSCHQSRKAVCFSCRKVFRRHPRKVALEVCPQCGGEVCAVNRMARVPRRRNVKAWKKAKEILTNGRRT